MKARTQLRGGSEAVRQLAAALAEYVNLPPDTMLDAKLVVRGHYEIAMRGARTRASQSTMRPPAQWP